nr:MAG TPA: hypothetical protein [Caudoviricetes sp.]
MIAYLLLLATTNSLEQFFTSSGVASIVISYVYLLNFL